MLRSAELNTFSIINTIYRDLVCRAERVIYRLSGKTPWRYDGKASCIKVKSYNGEQYATTVLKKTHIQNRDLYNIKRWGLLMDDVQLGGGGHWGDEISVNGEDEERLLSKLYPTSS